MPAFAAHRPEPGPVAPPQLSVGVARVAHAVHLLTDKKACTWQAGLHPAGHTPGAFAGAGVLCGGGRVQNDPGYKRGPGVVNMEPLAGLEPGIVTRPDRTVLCLSYNGMECAQLPATAACWSEWKGNRLAMLPCTLWDDVQNPRLFKGPAGYRPGRCRWIAKQNARLVHSGCWSVNVFPCRSRAIQKPQGVGCCPAPCGFRSLIISQAKH